MRNDQALKREEEANEPWQWPCQRSATDTDKIAIVVAEGDRLVRSVIEESLTCSGYNVLVAKDGIQALCLIAGYSGSLPLLIADLALPVMDGRRLAEGAARLRPGIKTLYLSGYPTQCVGLRPLSRCLQKPFTLGQLIHEVRAILVPPPNRSSEAHNRGGVGPFHDMESAAVERSYPIMQVRAKKYDQDSGSR